MSQAAAQTKYLFRTVTASVDDAGLPGCTISTINPDREADRVIPEGGDFANFMKSPVLMWAHGGSDGYASVPIGTVTSIEVVPGQAVKAQWRWLENDPFADRIKNAWEQGVVRASSIGFKPLQLTPNGQGFDMERWELLELSLCAIPMNPDCVRSLKSLGLTDDEASSPEQALAVDIVDPVQSQIAVIRAELDAVQKRGRVLSAVNESRLRAALQAMSDATGVLGEILNQLVTAPADEPAVEEPTIILDEPMLYSLDLAESAGEFRMTLADDPIEEAFVKFVDDSAHEQVFSIDPAIMQAVIAEALREQIVEPAVAAAQQALDRARGRVH